MAWISAQLTGVGELGALHSLLRSQLPSSPAAHMIVAGCSGVSCSALAPSATDGRGRTDSFSRSHTDSDHRFRAGTQRRGLEVSEEVRILHAQTRFGD